MIKIHDGVAVNPVNVVSIKVNVKELTVAVFLWNGRAHNIRCIDAKAARQCYALLLDQFHDTIDVFAYDGESMINIDAVVSIAKVTDGVAINLVNGNRILILDKDANGLFTMIYNRLCANTA